MSRKTAARFQSIQVINRLEAGGSRSEPPMSRKSGETWGTRLAEAPPEGPTMKLDDLVRDGGELTVIEVDVATCELTERGHRCSYYARPGGGPRPRLFGNNRQLAESLPSQLRRCEISRIEFLVMLPAALIASRC